MGATRRLILENKLGQKVRTYHVETGRLALIYRHDTRRVEIHADLEALKDVSYDVIRDLRGGFDKPVDIAGVGRLRLAVEGESLDDRTHELEEETRELPLFLKRSSIGHLVAVAALIALSFVTGYFAEQKPEPELVTIEMPKMLPPMPARERVQVAEKRPPRVPVAAVKRKTAPRPVVRPKPVQTAKVVAPQKHRMIVRNAPERSVQRIGALGALGGLKTGSKSAEGLDANSLRKIRAAGVGSGGGGVGDAGSGGIRGMMPGNGLIAGSSGSGGRAESAGGYGTRGVGGGQAGYGKISLVGGTSGLTLPLDEEAVVEGGLDRDQIAAVINRHRGQIIYCYEQGLQGQPDLRGRVSVSFVIGGNGRLTTAKVSQSSLGSSLVENCMVAKMKTWQFPRPVGNVEVDVLYPFELRRVTSR